MDIAFAVALGIVEHWRSLTVESLSVVHDASSNMAKEKWLWDAIVANDVPSQLVGFDERTVKFPLGVLQTAFEDSIQFRQLQLCDVLAGAVATWASSLTPLGQKNKSQYCQDLEAAGIRKTLCGALWPVPEIKKLRSQPGGERPADPFGFFADIIASARIE